MRDAPAIFVSYSRNDYPFVRDLVLHLERAGSDVWLDVERLQAGDPWSETIEAAIRGSDFVLVVLSPSSAASAEVNKELLLAASIHKRIIPVVLQRCKPPVVIEHLQWIDGRRSFRTALTMILATLNGRPIGGYHVMAAEPPWYVVLRKPAPLSVRWMLTLAILGGMYRILLSFVAWTAATEELANAALFVLVFHAACSCAYVYESVQMLRRKRTLLNFAGASIIMFIANAGLSMLCAFFVIQRIDAAGKIIMAFPAMLDSIGLVLVTTPSLRRWMITTQSGWTR